MKLSIVFNLQFLIHVCMIIFCLSPPYLGHVKEDPDNVGLPWWVLKQQTYRVLFYSLNQWNSIKIRELEVNNKCIPMSKIGKKKPRHPQKCVAQ